MNCKSWLIYPDPSPAWTPEPGDAIELRVGLTRRQGTVEDVTADGSGFWMAADGVEARLFVHKEYQDVEIWVSPHSPSTPRP